MFMAPALNHAWAISSGGVLETLISGPRKSFLDSECSWGRIFILGNYNPFLSGNNDRKVKVKDLNKCYKEFGFSSICKG